ncbi:MAG: hypothetical protein E3J64_07640 [Anaerolineales bacterium]|nr:MAG: hypothetical protein E3J64_07640 [Anaerolineales bacterium]
MVEVIVFGASVEPGIELDLEGREISVTELLERLEIDPAGVGIVTVDGRQSGLEEVVSESSRVCIFPPMFGG